MRPSLIIYPLLTVLLLCSGFNLYAQSNFELITDRPVKIRFKLIDNLIVVPMDVNGVKLSFILDTGVSKPILFNIVNLADSLKINQVESIYLRGLGGGESIEALRSSNNTIRVGNAVNISQDLFVILDESINFTPRLGVPIHGIIGYDLFKDFAVEINYSNRYIKLHDPNFYDDTDCRKCETLDLSFYKNKPYVDLSVTVENKPILVKLLIDTGGSDAIWLFEDRESGLYINDSPYFKDFLGLSLSGSVFGKRTKIDELHLKSYVLKNVKASFPDSTAIIHAKQFSERNGTVAGEILKRFNLVIDYQNAKFHFRKNGMFKKEFNYNKSGLILEQNGLRLVKEKNIQQLLPGNYGQENKNSNAINIQVESSYNLAIKPAIIIAELREKSPAERVGLLVGDVILNVNGKDTSELKLQNVNEMFQAEEGKKMTLLIDRNGILMKFTFRLESALK